MEKATKWIIDKANSEITFKVKHLMISNVKGTFKIFHASIYTRDNNFTSAEIDLEIDAASLDTNDAKRDEHLKGADFFDVKKNKYISFASIGITKSNEKGQHDLIGTLTIKNITRRIILNVEFGGTILDPWGDKRAGFTITGKINRTDWGLTWNAKLEAGGVIVSEEIFILCEIQLVKANRKMPEINPESQKEEKVITD